MRLISKLFNNLLSVGVWLLPFCCCSSTIQASGQSNQDHTSAACEMIHQFLKLHLFSCCCFSLFMLRTLDCELLRPLTRHFLTKQPVCDLAGRPEDDTSGARRSHILTGSSEIISQFPVWCQREFTMQTRGHAQSRPGEAWKAFNYTCTRPCWSPRLWQYVFVCYLRGVSWCVTASWWTWVRGSAACVTSSFTPTSCCAPGSSQQAEGECSVTGGLWGIVVYLLRTYSSLFDTWVMKRSFSQEAGPVQVLLVSASRPSQTSLGCRAGTFTRHTPSLTRHENQDVPLPTTAAATQSCMFVWQRRKYREEKACSCLTDQWNVEMCLCEEGVQGFGSS